MQSRPVSFTTSTTGQYNNEVGKWTLKNRDVGVEGKADEISCRFTSGSGVTGIPISALHVYENKGGDGVYDVHLRIDDFSQLTLHEGTDYIEMVWIDPNCSKIIDWSNKLEISVVNEK